MAQWHSMDLTNFDLAPALRTAEQIRQAVTKRAVETAKDATYITVGFGLLAVQRAQVQRREFERQLRP